MTRSDDGHVDAVVPQPIAPVDRLEPRPGGGQGGHAAPSAATGATARSGFRDELHDARGTHLTGTERADDVAVTQDDEAVGPLDDLLEIGADEDDREPLDRELAHERLDLCLRAHIDAAGRIVEDEHPGGHREHPREQHLLLVATGQLRDALVAVRRLDLQAVDELVRDGILGLAREQPEASQGRQDAQRDVVPDREARHDALGLAVLGDHGDARGDRGAHRTGCDHAAPHRYAAGIEGLRPVDGLRGRAAAGPEQAREAHDLAGVHDDVHVLEHVAPGEPVRLEHDLALIGPGLVPETRDPGGGRDLPAQHEPDQAQAGERGDRARVDEAAIPQHGHRVADPEDLVEPVRDVDDGDALCPEHRDRGEQAIDLGGFERRGRLIHDEHAMPLGHGARDGHGLLGPEAQVPERPADIHAHPVSRHHGRGAGPHPVEVHEAQAVGRLAPQEQVARDAQLGDQVDLLVDGADAGQLRVARPGEMGHLTHEPQLARVGLVDARHALDERGLAGTVLADERVDLTGHERQGHLVERHDAAEALADAKDPEDRCGGRLVQRGRRRQVHPVPRLLDTRAASVMEGTDAACGS